MVRVREARHEAKEARFEQTMTPGALTKEHCLILDEVTAWAPSPSSRDIRQEFPYSRFAALSELRIGDCQFKNEEYPEAIQTYRQFVRIRPSHKEIPYARFRIAEAYFNQIPSGWFMTPPVHERDQSAARDALIQLRRFVVDFPDDQRVPDANELMEKCMGLLAAHELYVARFYLRRDAYRGVISRLRGLLASYPGRLCRARGSPLAWRGLFEARRDRGRPSVILGNSSSVFPKPVKRRRRKGFSERSHKAREADFWPAIEPIVTLPLMAPWARELLDAANEHYDSCRVSASATVLRKAGPAGLALP